MRALRPPYAPTSGRPLRLEGGSQHDLHWRNYADAEVRGGVLLVGSNFAPTDFLWCAFSMDPQQVVTARGPWRWTRGLYATAF